MDWVSYLNDAPATEMGTMSASNGHAEPYGVKLFQIDNEPMNNGFTPKAYAEIVNVYASALRHIAPDARIVACGQKRSNDMDWSETVIDLAGNNFDILGCHNYEYEPETSKLGCVACGLPNEAVRLRAGLEAPEHRSCRPGMEPAACSPARHSYGMQRAQYPRTATSM